jgi:preprotein translocase subunit SecA
MSVRAIELLSDPYPQRRDWGISPLSDRLYARFQAGCKQLFSNRSVTAARFVSEVQRRQQSLDHETRPLELDALRRALRAQGLADSETLAACFAEVCRQSREVLGLQPFRTQIEAAWFLVHRRAVELDTGEGKTLTAALAATAAALAGLRVHVITANDYLAARDAEELRPLYERFGLSVGAVVEATPAAARRAIYRSDIVYCSNKTISFDYLRDRVLYADRLQPLRLILDRWMSSERQSTLPGLVFAIIDEVDSVLVDEARTPLVLSRSIDDSFQAGYFAQAVEIAAQLTEDRDFIAHAVTRRQVLTEEGAARLPTLVQQLTEPSPIWASARRTEEAVTQALYAIHGLTCDVHYVVRDGKVMIVDENTGRVMPDRTWEMGLHQMVEVKEGLPPSPARVTIARISFQLFFRRYLSVSGMSGTCRELSGEFFDLYGMSSVRVKPLRRSLRRALGTRIHLDGERRLEAVTNAIAREAARGRPVLVGTRTVRASEEISRRLAAGSIPHQVLNARQDADEADCIARAGAARIVTIATNMAGRGTDIKLEESARQAGGLHVIITELHDNQRVQRQLIGRCARQGDPGSWEAILSADDDLIIERGPRLSAVMRMLACGNGWRGPRHWLALGLLRLVQWRIERRHRRMRINLLIADLDRRDALGFTGISE